MTLDQAVKIPNAEHSEWSFGGPGLSSFGFGGGHSTGTGV